MPHVALGSHYEEFVRKQLESGRFSDASEVVRAGLRLLEDLEQARDRWIDEEIPARYDDMMRDPSLAVSAESVRARFDAKRKRDAGQAE
ncbi:type II toxin-antitoxin system ParD family antitoxin [Rhizobium sp. RU36D]|uniref:type II toxin-antitoxin system ParD family antitoxin n=1 Tax=Rhizobium sp. RU36D TaxID=1907415 RepID=UPI0009D913D8|nr:type II toxin-antitoxin system ParD family antitoxin [Rhizobium sp. RU36D]SMC99736.1 antitoxin ParD1/3/4 [Rhizobium sp. RU36D]